MTAALRLAPADAALVPAEAVVDLPSLMERYCAGDLAAFQALYAACAPMVLAYLRPRHPGPREVAPLLDETFSELHARRGCYVRGADPLAWLMDLAAAVDARAHRRREPSWLRRGLMKLAPSARGGRVAA